MSRVLGEEGLLKMAVAFSLSLIEGLAMIPVHMQAIGPCRGVHITPTTYRASGAIAVSKGRN